MLPIRSPLSTMQILDQILNCTSTDPPLPPKPQTRISAHHTILPPDLRHSRNNFTILHQLRNHSCRRLTRESAELDGSLGVTCAFAHSAGPRLQRDDVAGAAEGVNLRGGGGESAAGQRAVFGGDTGCHGVVGGVDGDCVGCALGVGVFGYHLREGEAGCEVGCYGGAYEAAGEG